jgi:hypothetical protein
LKRGSYKIHPAKHRNFANSKGDIGRRRVKNIARRAANTADTPVNIREVNFPGTIRVSFIKKQRRQRVFYPLNCGAVGIFDPRDFNIDDFLDRGTYENNGSVCLLRIDVVGDSELVSGGFNSPQSSSWDIPSVPTGNPPLSFRSHMIYTPTVPAPFRRRFTHARVTPETSSAHFL